MFFEMNSDLKSWRQYHSDESARKCLPSTIADGWSRSIKRKIDPMRLLPEAQEDLTVVKRSLRLLYISSINIMSELVALCEGTDCGFLFFSPNGCLFSIKGTKSFLNWAEEVHIYPGTSWHEAEIGPNIFSVGIGQSSPTVLQGAENYLYLLTGACYCFAPITLNQKCYGGIAFTTRFDMPSKLMMSLIVAVVRNIELQMFWLNTISAHSYAVDSSVGSLILDQSTGENRIISCNAAVCKLLDISPETVFYDDVETIVLGLPHNKEFWNIIQKKKQVHNERIELIGRNGISNIIELSSALFTAPKLHINGVTLSFRFSDALHTPTSGQEHESVKGTFDDIITNNPTMKKIINHSKVAARYDSNILLLGESGVGKDIFARAIHNNSLRKNGPFIALNCASFSKELISSELFGYEGGAFSGAKREGSIGKLQLADGGTLFLDEIGDMPLDLQAILLRVLEEKAFRKVGGNTLHTVDVRIVAATNKNLLEEIEKKCFRRDLYYRLGVIQINIPPLRERGKDAILLAEFFIQEICKRIDRPAPRLTRTAKKCIADYAWPGNIRELHNIMESILCTHSSTEISKQTLLEYMDTQANNPPYSSDIPRKRYSEIEIIHALDLAKGHRDRAAKHLGVSRSTLYRYMKRYDLL